MTRKDKDELISFFRDAEGYDWREILHEYCYDILKEDTDFASEIDILSVSELGNDDTEKPVKNLQEFVESLYNKIMEGVCNVIETQNDEWIPTSKYLPEESGNYLVSYSDYDGEGYVAIFRFDKDDLQDLECWRVEFDAWMPLPEPYVCKGGTNERDSFSRKVD